MKEHLNFGCEIFFVFAVNYSIGNYPNFGDLGSVHNIEKIPYQSHILARSLHYNTFSLHEIMV